MHASLVVLSSPSVRGRFAGQSTHMAAKMAGSKVTAVLTSLYVSIGQISHSPRVVLKKRPARQNAANITRVTGSLQDTRKGHSRLRAG